MKRFTASASATIISADDNGAEVQFTLSDYDRQHLVKYALGNKRLPESDFICDETGSCRRIVNFDKPVSLSRPSKSKPSRADADKASTSAPETREPLEHPQQARHVKIRQMGSLHFTQLCKHYVVAVQCHCEIPEVCKYAHNKSQAEEAIDKCAQQGWGTTTMSERLQRDLDEHNQNDLDCVKHNSIGSFSAAETASAKPNARHASNGSSSRRGVHNDSSSRSSSETGAHGGINDGMHTRAILQVHRSISMFAHPNANSGLNSSSIHLQGDGTAPTATANALHRYITTMFPVSHELPSLQMGKFYGRCGLVHKDVIRASAGGLKAFCLKYPHILQWIDSHVIAKQKVVALVPASVASIRYGTCKGGVPMQGDAGVGERGRQSVPLDPTQASADVAATVAVGVEAEARGAAGK